MVGVLGAVTDVDPGEVEDALGPRVVFEVRGRPADVSGQEGMLREDSGNVVCAEVPAVGRQFHENIVLLLSFRRLTGGKHVSGWGNPVVQLAPGLCSLP